MKKTILVGLILLLNAVVRVQAEVPKISNLRFLTNPAVIGEWFTITVDFEGDVDKIFLENTWETQTGEKEHDVKEYEIPRHVREKQKGLIPQRWKVASQEHKPYRIIKVWVLDRSGNQSNALSEELRLVTEPPREEKNYQRVVVLSDMHLPGNNVPAKQKAIDDVNCWADADMVAVTGDICEEHGTVEEYAFAKKFLNQLNKPFYPIVGNHDYIFEDNRPGTYKRTNYAIRKRKLERFKDAFSLQELFYSKRVGPYQLIFLSTDDLYSDSLCEMSAKQIDWWQSELKKNKNIPTIIFFHAPLKGTLTGNFKLLDTDGGIAQPQRKILKILLENPQIFLWVSGHIHITPRHESFNHKVNIYEKQVVVIPNPDMKDDGKGRTDIWTNSLYLYPDRVVVRTYDHKHGYWWDELKREIKPPAVGTN